MIENYLSKLGKLLQKRARKDFKQDLRAQLLARAVELNETPVKRGFTWPSWDKLWVRRLVPATAAVLLLVLVFQFVLPKDSGLLPQLVNIAEAKDYYTMTATEDDATGVASESEFILSSKGSLSVSEVEEQLTIMPAAELEFEQVSANEVAIKPADNLDPGTVYTFALAAQNLSDAPYPKEYQWAYEVSDGFRITGTLPGNQEAGVPSNSGIEVYFTNTGVDVDAFKAAFSISPAIGGSYSINGKTGVFAPTGGLTEGTIYTVTISGDLGLTNTDKTLGEDYSFSFEVDGYSRKTTHLSFTKNIYEFSPEDLPSMQTYFWDSNGDESDLTVHLGVYSYETSEDFLAALKDYSVGAPEWCYYQRDNYHPSTSGLQQILDETEYQLTNENGNYHLVLPESLADGAYLVQLSKNDALTSTFIQVSSHAVYINVNPTNTLLWVNDTTTGKPIEGAEVSLVDSDLSTVTGTDGVATLTNVYDKAKVTHSEFNNLFFEVNSGDLRTYYSTPFFSTSSDANDDYWQLLRTDRSTYQPTDTAYYWGFVQGRKEALDGEVSYSLVEGYFWDDIPLSRLRDTGTIIETGKLKLKDGEVFEGKLDLHQLETGTYHLLISEGDELLSSTSFSVQPYVKPAYNLSISADKTALMLGETSNITVHAEFFEGTPVANTQLRVQTPDGEEHLLSTDENGDIELSWVAEDQYSGWYGLYNYEYAFVSPVQEELGEIREELAYKTFSARATLTNDSEVTNDLLHFQVMNVDLSAVDYQASHFDSYNNYEAIYGTPLANAKVDVKTVQVEYVKVKTGEVYDENDKVVRETYDYERKETELPILNLTAGSDGVIDYEPGYSEDYNYEVEATVYDADGKSYKESFYISNGNTYFTSDNDYVELQFKGLTDGETPTVQVGDEVTLEAHLTSGNELSGNLLFMQEQAGIQTYEVSTADEYQFTFGEEDVPSVTVSTIYFDGQVYIWGGYETIMLDTSDRRMDLEIKPDQESYGPGDQVSLDIQASEEGQVNLYLVDEAYYELFAEEFRDPLELIYTPIGLGVDYNYISHQELSDSVDGGKGGCFVAGTQILMADGSNKNIEDIEVGDRILTRASAWDSTLVPTQVLNTVEHSVSDYLLINNSLGVTEEHVILINGQWQLAGKLKVGDTLLNSDGEKVAVESILHIHDNVKVYNFESEDKHTYFANGIYVHNDKGGSREDFRDTAFFTVVQTDESGHASVSFKLPDNITRWRLTGAAVSGGKEIHAGYTTATIDVSMPLFVTPIVNSSYLEGDQVKIPVRAYGDALEEGDDLSFSMKVDDTDLGSTDGTAFKTTYFDIGSLSLGTHKIATKVSGDGNDDTVILPTQVLTSHLSASFVDNILLSENVKLTGPNTGRTEVTFVNGDTGLVYGTLLGAYFGDGDRADEALSRKLAGEWLSAYFDYATSESEFATDVYQSEDGGIALLPYADSDLELSAKMAALSPTDLNANNLEGYFAGILNDNERTLNEKMMALYGLAGLQKPYLNELDYFVTNFDLSDEDKLYAALAYSEYGQDLSATVFFLQVYDKEGDAEWNAELAAVAQSIGSDLADELWNKAMGQKIDELAYLPLEEMLFAKARLASGAQKTVSFKINGEKIKLEAGLTASYSFTADELQDLDLTDFNGKVRAVTFYQNAVEIGQLQTDSRIEVERHYEVNGKEVSTVKTGDMVEVHIDVNIPASLYENGFQITDILPSGLQTATWADASNDYTFEADYRHPYNHDGQKVSFYASCNKEGICYGTHFYYLARVINTGSFVTEPVLMQSFTDPDVLTISGDRGTLTIE